MSEVIPASHRDLFEKKALALLACRLADGSTLVNPVWCLLEDGRVVVNSVVGRVKDRALRRDPRVTLCLTDPDNPYRYLEVRGRVEAITTEDGEAMIDRLAQKYMGVERYPNHKAGDVRVTYRIVPEKAIPFPR